ncbi:MAG TPA: mechanosensitive ion channel domain-containing protein [Pseudomonadales bacterium]|nr:mechanosensitive ion channel domain-containing protein [Pseudomonadales bacterium]
MEQFTAFLEYELMTLSGQPISVADLLIIPTVLLAGYLIARLVAAQIGRTLGNRGVSADVVHLVVRVFYVVAIAVLAITVLDMLRVPLTAFAFVSGAIAIGVGFGAQNIINNFISGWILMWERPIRIGDFLEVADAKGTVESINTRSTRIRRVDGVHMLIPNSALLENTVVNWTLVDDRMRSTLRIGVAYGSPVREVKRLMELAIDEHEDVLKDPARLIIFEDFGDNALIFDAYYWVQAHTEKDVRRIRSDLRFRLDDLFAEAGITIAFPQRDVHLDGTLLLERRDAEPAAAKPSQDA